MCMQAIANCLLVEVVLRLKLLLTICYAIAMHSLVYLVEITAVPMCCVGKIYTLFTVDSSHVQSPVIFVL